jgi:hypothetical protein
MRLAALIAILGAAACGAKTKLAAPPVPGHAPAGITGPGVGDNLGKCGALAKDALCACLVDDEVQVCELVDDGKLAAHVLRAGNQQQTDTYLVVDEGAGLRPIVELLYEQHHGKRDSDLTNPHLELRTIHGARVVRLEYGVSGSTDYASEGYDETLQGTAVKVCVLDGAAGAPSCPVETFSTCTAERSDHADPPNPANNGKGDASAKVEIADDGTVTVTKLAEHGTPFDCTVADQTVHLVP